jgi:hypothetical protein
METQIKERFICEGCEKRYILTFPAEASPKRERPTCPTCGLPMVTAACQQMQTARSSREALRKYLNNVKVTADKTKSLWQRLRVSLGITWPIKSVQLRRCRNCHLTVMMSPGPCANCGGPTVSVDPGAHLDDLDDVLISNQALMQSLFRNVKKVRISVVGIGTATVLVLFARDGFFTTFFFSAIAVAALLGCYYLYVSWVNKRLSSSSSLAANRLKRLHADSARLEAILKDIIYPFFDRNGIAPFDRPVIQPEELILLNRTLASRGLQIPSSNLETFLASAALDRDYQRFAAQAELMRNECGDALAGYASLYPDARYDGKLLPFLQQYLATLGQEWALDVILPKLVQHHQTYKQHGFERDLELRKGGVGRVITIEDVDRVDPFNFELLLGMIFETQGYSFEETPKTGDQGADVLLSKAGERTVVQAKLYIQPVGNGSVQEAIAAKTYFRCHHAMVVTNNTFTASARALAASASVQLVDRNSLIPMIEAFNRSPKDYHRLRILMLPRDDTEEELVADVMPSSGKAEVRRSPRANTRETP